MAKDYDKDMVIADWKTGGYNIRSLAHKHGIGKTTAGNIVKDIEKSLSDKVDMSLKINQELRELSDKDGQAVQEVIAREDAKRIKAEKISSYIDTGLGLAAKKGVEIIQDSDATMQDVSGFGKFALDAKKSLGTLEEKPTTLISQNNDSSVKTNVMQVPVMSQEDWNKKATESQEKLINEQ